MKPVSPKSGGLQGKRAHLMTSPDDSHHHSRLHSPQNASLYTVYKPIDLQKPYLKWYPCRETMQRLVNRYMLLIWYRKQISYLWMMINIVHSFLASWASWASWFSNPRFLWCCQRWPSWTCVKFALPFFCSRRTSKESISQISCRVSRFVLQLLVNCLTELSRSFTSIYDGDFLVFSSPQTP